MIPYDVRIQIRPVEKHKYLDCAVDVYLVIRPEEPG